MGFMTLRAVSTCWESPMMWGGPWWKWSGARSLRTGRYVVILTIIGNIFEMKRLCHLILIRPVMAGVRRRRFFLFGFLFIYVEEKIQYTMCIHSICQYQQLGRMLLLKFLDLQSRRCFPVPFMHPCPSQCRRWRNWSPASHQGSSLCLSQRFTL